MRAMCAKKKKKKKKKEEEELGNDQINCSYEIVMYGCLQLFIWMIIWFKFYFVIFF